MRWAESFANKTERSTVVATDIPLRTVAGELDGGERFEMSRTGPIKIIIVNFDPELSHPQHANVWTPLKEAVEAALGVSERQAREDLWLHFDHTTTVDSIKKAIERVTHVAGEFTGHIIGIVSSKDCNRLAFFHSEQSNSFKPITDMLKRLPGGGVVAIVTQDYVKEGAEMMWRSAEITQAMEMQVQSSAMIGDRGLVLSWYKRPYTVHGRALAAFTLGMSGRPEDQAFPLPPLPARFQHSSRQQKKKSILNVLRYGLLLIPFVMVRVIFQCTPWWSIPPSCVVSYFSYRMLRSSPMQKTRFHLIYRTDTFNREVKPQVDQFVNNCLAGTHPLTDAGVAANAECPFQKAHLPSRESLQRWAFDSEGFRNVAVLFTAADAYYDNPSQLDGDISVLLESGFKHCVICAMFDAGFLDVREDMDQIRSARLEQRVTVPRGPASLVSWYSHPANAITRELLQTGVVPSR